MAYGMQIYNEDNTIAYDSSSPGGVFVQFVTLPNDSTTGTNIFNLSSNYNAMTIQLFIVSSGEILKVDKILKYIGITLLMPIFYVNQLL